MREGPFVKTINYILHAMAPSKPRTAVYKDSVVAYLALKSHFAISDNRPYDRSVAALSALMLST